jgi:hypothetical protein
MRKIDRPVCPRPDRLVTNYKYPENKEALVSASFGKCMYCESYIQNVYFGDVEHIKPKSKYPELEFEWTNLGFVCAKCNGNKKDRFDDSTPYVNPYEENPDEFIIAVGALLKNKRGNERGELTITDIGLNRNNLIEKRQEKLELVSRFVDACMRTSNQRLKDLALEELKKEAEADKEFSLFIKMLLERHQIL